MNHNTFPTDRDMLKPFYVAFLFLRICPGYRFVDFCVMPVRTDKEAKKIEEEHRLSIRCNQDTVDIIVDELTTFVNVFNDFLGCMHYS